MTQHKIIYHYSALCIGRVCTVYCTVSFTAWKYHIISGAGKPSAEQDQLTAVPTNSSTLSGSVINLGATKKHYFILYTVYCVIYKSYNIW